MTRIVVAMAKADVSIIIRGETLEATSRGVRDIVISFVPRPDRSFRMTAPCAAGGKALIKGRIAGDVH